jgi:alcohol dehydrogenase class IV
MSNLISDIARSVGLPPLKRAAGVITRRLPIPQPLLLVGPGSSAKLGAAIADFGHRKLLVVTDASIAALGLLSPLTDALAQAGAAFAVFDAITPDAPIEQVEQGIAAFSSLGCDAVIGFGGGSVIDAAKVIALASANGKHPRELVGYFKGWHAPAPIYAVPTTAGTGSEVTVAAVVSDPTLGTKLVIADTRLVPLMAAIDPCLMTCLPPAITAATGMDALTHAIEALISGWSTAHTDRLAMAAVAMVYRHLPKAYRDGGDLHAREQMALAASYAGLAFTRTNVGNVHAIAHQLGGRYHTPHGLANAIMLPQVLRFSAPATSAVLARLALRVGLGDPSQAQDSLADQFLDSIEAMNDQLGIPRLLATLREQDIAALAAAACWEADTNYPVPRRMTQADCEAMLRAVLAPQTVARRAPRKKPPNDQAMRR